MEVVFSVVVVLLLTGLIISLLVIKHIYSNNCLLINKNNKLKVELDKTKYDNEEILSIDIGDRAIIPDYGLVYTEDNKSFKVTYEVEILEISVDKVKVNAIDFTPNDKVGRDPKKRSGIIQFMQNKWVPKKEIELVVDESMKRDAKLRKLGIE